MELIVESMTFKEDLREIYEPISDLFLNGDSDYGVVEYFIRDTDSNVPKLLKGELKIVAHSEPDGDIVYMNKQNSTLKRFYDYNIRMNFHLVVANYQIADETGKLILALETIK